MAEPMMFLIAAAILVPLVWSIATYNRFVGLRQRIRESWADIDLELKRRYDLIPNLINTVRNYAEHERGVLDAVVVARTRAMAGTGNAARQGDEESTLQLALGKVFALSEGYPALRASEQFLALQQGLATTEDRIAAARRFYNANVRDFNAQREMFPSRIIGSWMGLQEAPLFELASEAERVVPRVE